MSRRQSDRGVLPCAGRAVIVNALVLLLAACGTDETPVPTQLAEWAPAPASDPRCASHDPLRQAFFGDTHVHTTLSSDAYSFDVRVRPDGAYRYAFGETILLPPNEPDGQGTRPVRIDRPLDFAAVTDHAEFLGEGLLCLDPEEPGYDSAFCDSIRHGTGRDPRLVLKIMNPWSGRDGEACGEDGARCLEATAIAWKETQRAAAEWNDETPACQRTTFVAYEYSSFRMGSNLHRNVIFRNATVPALPTSFIEEHREWGLWAALQRDCLDAGNGCDVIAIPHNSNISNGRMFAVDYPGAASEEEQRVRASLRVRVEPLVEIMQHKGDSECRPGIEGVLGDADELCAFEKFENMAFDTTTGGSDPGACYDGPLADAVPHLGPNCVSPLSYVRGALVEGLKEEARIGVNPFKLGISASTDTHNALAGGVEERSFPGHLGIGDDEPIERTSWDSQYAGNASNNPGGLFGVWAEENSRESLFTAMRRREVFGTSGPRIRIRFFGGEALPEDLCRAPDMIAEAYASGVPMGSDLPAGSEAAPRFLVSALRDPGTEAAPGGLLQRVQIIKGWADAEGQHHQRVFDVAGTPAGEADVDLTTCEPRGPGHEALCAVWEDPEWEPGVAAVYYARAVENPSCRYTTWQCLAMPEDERPADCRGGAYPLTIQERAWSSPIWSSP